MMYYGLLMLSVVMFSLQFLFNKRFEEEQGTSVSAAMLFTLYSSIGGFVLLLVPNGCRIACSAFSLWMATIYAVVGILYTIAGIKAIGEVNLSAYSVFAMLGGMLLPSLYGILFCGEDISVMKLMCYILMAGALVFAIDFKKKSGKIIYYAAVFVLNGMVGVVSAMHQSGATAVDSSSFLMLARIISAVIAIPFCLFKSHELKKTTVKAASYSVGYAVLCTVGNLLVLIALKHLPASVQYPIITGGVMLVSLVISVLRKEGVTRKNVISVSIAFASAVLIAL